MSKFAKWTPYLVLLKKQRTIEATKPIYISRDSILHVYFISLPMVFVFAFVVLELEEQVHS